MAGETQPVEWREAVWVLLGCSAMSAVAWGILFLWGGRDQSLPPAAVVILSQWFWTRHRFWFAGSAAAVTGSVTAFLLTDELRPHLDRLSADAVAVEAGVLVALVVFAVCARLRFPRRAVREQAAASTGSGRPPAK
ncbi:hypothetical protein AB0942_12325 [Streptomyces nodosus]|uniref:hypothetical protein n=1 Tax=Streptomyces nodosus TaxID=40318 RepID=UPI003454ECD6